MNLFADHELDQFCRIAENGGDVPLVLNEEGNKRVFPGITGVVVYSPERPPFLFEPNAEPDGRSDTYSWQVFDEV